jgi:tetratricopeptide (TPR) repeat protein
MLMCVFWRLDNPPIKPKEDKLISNGIKRIESGQYMKAYRSIRRAISLNPNNPVSLELLDILGLSWLPRAASDVKNPVATASHLLDKYPESPYIKILSSEVYLSAGDSEKATDLLIDVLASNPDIPHAWFVLGTAQKAKGEIDSAIISVQRAIDLKPQEEYFSTLGKLYFEKQNWEFCRENLHRVAIEDKLRLSSRLIYLRCLLYTGKFKETMSAGEDLNRILHSLPRLPKSFLEKVTLATKNNSNGQLTRPSRELLIEYVETIVDIAQTLNESKAPESERHISLDSEVLRPVIEYDLQQINKYL